MTAQAPYMKINDEVPVALGRSAAQLAGTRIDVADRRFYVYLAGRPTPALLALRSHAQAQGITLDIKYAKFSRRQLVAAIPRVVAAMPAGASGPGYAIDLATDGSGLTINFSGAALPARVIRQVNSLSRSTGIPVNIHTDAPKEYPA